MVHKKSTYRLTYRNYAPHVRQRVWQENNTIRMRRREEERSHQSIEESDSDCLCDESEEEGEAGGRSLRGLGTGYLTGPRGRFTSSQEQLQDHTAPQGQQSGPPPHVPRLRFTPDHSPRASERQSNPDDSEDGSSSEGVPGQQEGVGGSAASLRETQDTGEDQMGSSRVRARSAGTQMGVMRPGSRAREYDLIPATRDRLDMPERQRGSSARARVVKSRQLPFTSQLTRTTRRNYHNRDRTTFVPFGTGSSVRHIGDKTSFNIHLNKNQVQPTALQASTYRNKEIEKLIKKQKDLTLDDWRKGREVATPPVNHSSLWADGREQIFSSTTQPRMRPRRTSSRVEVFSNYCRHCGGRK